MHYDLLNLDAKARYKLLTGMVVPANVSEGESVGLLLAPSATMETPRIVGSPGAPECRWERTVHIGDNRVILRLGHSAYIENSMLLDAARFLVDSPRLDLVGRMDGTGGYTVTRGYFNIERKRYNA